MERMKAEEPFEQNSADGGQKRSDAETMRRYALAALQAMNEYAAQGDMPSARSAVNALWELGDFQREIKNFSGAESSFKRMEELCLELPGELQGRESERWLAVSCNKLGSLLERKGNAAEARGYYSRALEISERIAAEENSNEARDDLAVANYRLGFIDYLFSGEKSRLDRAYDIWTELYEQTGNYEYRRRRSIIDTLCATADVPQAVSDEGHLAEPSGEKQTDAVSDPELNTRARVKITSEGAAAAIIITIAAAVLAVCIWLLLR